MFDAVRLLSKAALDSVRDVPEPFEGYHADLVTTFTRVLHVLHTEPSDRAQRRAVEDLIVDFAAQVSSRLGELQ